MESGAETPSGTYFSDFARLSRLPRRCIGMTLNDLDSLPAPGRYSFRLTDRLTVIVMIPIDDVVIFGLFFDGRLVRMTREPAGKA